MPFSINDAFVFKRTERDIREIHEREYDKFVANLRKQRSYSNISFLQNDNLHEIDYFNRKLFLNRENQYKRIQQENEILSKRFYPSKPSAKHPIRSNNLEIFYSKRTEQRCREYKRIEQENHLLLKRLTCIQGNLMTKEEYERDWQRHVEIMKKNCQYPENIDRFISK